MLSKLSVKQPYTVAVAIIAILILGVISFMNMTTDLLPSMDLPYVVVITTYPGASPEEVEMVVTKPLEAGLATVNNMSNVTSVSRENMSQVILEFVDGSNMDTAMIEINNMLDRIKPNWPAAVGSPILMKLNPDMLPVMIAAVDVEGMDPYALTDFVSESITPRLEAINGVASVSESGLIEQEITVSISQELIDEVNYLILKEVDGELSKVEDQLRDGEAQLKNAKSQLAEQGAAGLKQIDDALKQIQDGKTQLDASLAELKAQRDELDETVTQLKMTEAILKAALDQAPREMTQAQKTELAAMNSQLSSLKTQKATAESNLAAIEAEIAGWHSPSQSGSTGSGKDLQTLERERDVLKAQITVLNGSISLIERSDRYLLLTALELAVTQRPQLEAQYAEVQQGLAQAQAGLDQMNGMISKLEQGIVPGGVIEGIDEETNINEAESQLSATRGQVKSQMDDASAQIANAQSELGKARREFEEKRDEALKEAKIDGIITVQLVSQILTAQNFQMPAGYISEGEQDFLVRVGDKFTTLEDMQSMLLFNLDGLETVDEIRLSDVATVTMTDNAATSYSKINGNNGIMLSFQKQSTFSTAEVAETIKQAFVTLESEYENLHLVALFDQGIYINIVVDSVLENLIYGALLAVLILLIFLGDYRPTVIIACSIPISVVTAFVAMYFSGITLNVISLAGLALGVGMLVDNSIVVIENIYRLHGNGMPLIKACVKGAQQMSGPIFSSTLTTICVFLPIVFIEGLARQLFTDMGLTIAYSLLASLIVALTLVPAMSASLLKRQKKRKHRIFSAIQRGYTAVLKGALKMKIITLAIAVALLIWSVAQIAALGTSFMPEVDSTQMTASLTIPDDATFSEQSEMADDVMDVLMGFDDVNTIGVFSGGSGGGLLGGGSGSSMTFYLLLNDDKSARNDEIARDMGKALEPLGYEVSFSTSNMDISMLYGSGIQVNVKGPELDTLREVATDVADIMRAVEGTMNVSDGQEKTVPELSIVVDKEKAINEGLTVAQVYSFVATTIADGSEATQLTLSDKEFPVIVVDGDNQLLTRADIAELYIEATKGDEKNEIRLGDIARIVETDSLVAINRDAQQRTLTAGCEIDPDYNIGIVGAALEEKLNAYEPPSGYTVAIEGENEAINSTLNDLGLMIALAVVLIYLIMVAQFQSFLSPFIVIFTIPLAFTGGLLALILAKMEMSMIAMLGFLMLSGVIVNNGIVFVDSVNQMRIEGMSKRDALIETGRVRLRPILMTTLTTVLGMSTIALGSGMGAEMMQPMAVVTIGGLSYGTLMTLFVVPVLYDIFNRRKKMKVRDFDGELGEEKDNVEALEISSSAESPL